MKLSTLLALVVVTLAPSGAWASPASDEADIANSLAKQGCYDTAVMFYEKALRLNPGFGPAIAGRAAALKRLKSGGKGKKGRDDAATPPTALNKVAEKAAKTAELAAVKAAENSARSAESAARARSQEEAAAKRTAQVAANAAKAAQAQAAATAAAIAKAKTAAAAPKTKPGAAAKPKPAVAVGKPKLVVAAAKPKPAPETKPTVVAAAAPPRPVAPAQPKPVADLIPQAKPIAVASIGHAATNPVSSVLATSRPAATKPTAPASSQNSAVEHSIPSDVGSAPPLSSLGNDGSRPSIGDKVPTWLYGMAAGTFLLLIVLAIWWLSPTLTASRQLQNRLKGLERTRDER